MITIIDYGAGNVGSVLNMVKHVGGQARTVSDAASLMKSSKILLPGVGSFDNAMTRLKNLNLIEPLKELVNNDIPLLGICLGMQLLADSSEEGETSGLGLIPGRVRKFNFDTKTENYKVPHMGWNTAELHKDHPLVNSLPNDARFYFVHSYYYDCNDKEDILLKSHHGISFTSGVQRANIMGLQFHPEKSHRYGMQILKNFVEL
jgi:imidazole glycerol-phosphate synthase subunit HisH